MITVRNGHDEKQEDAKNYLMNPRSRRLALYGPDGVMVSDLGTINLTGIPNSDVRTAFSVAVQEHCDLGHWHVINHVTLPPWGDE